MLTPEPPDWVAIPAGRFVMGGGPRSNEQPAHEVEVSAFQLARAPVRRREYQAFLDRTGRAAPLFWQEPAYTHDEAPAVGPTWHDADAYCRWLSEQLGYWIGLPTEAQWEWAARAGRDVAYPWGDGGPSTLPDYESRWLHGPEPVDAYPSLHPWGLVGLCENIHEWCSDWYSADYYSESPVVNPVGPASGRRKASRGGAWRHDVKVCRVTHRSSIPPDKSYSDYGFRIVSDISV